MPTGETTGRAETPNRFPWPPVLIAGALVLSWVGDAVRPLLWQVAPKVHLVAGLAILAAAVLLLQWGFWTFRRAKANIRPDRAATCLITTGPFAFSRNPLYLAEALVLAGLGVLLGSLWYWIALMLFVPAVTHLAIRREEAHLAARFGETWDDYAGRVRRWL